MRKKMTYRIDQVPDPKDFKTPARIQKVKDAHPPEHWGRYYWMIGFTEAVPGLGALFSVEESSYTVGEGTTWDTRREADAQARAALPRVREAYIKRIMAPSLGGLELD